MSQTRVLVLLAGAALSIGAPALAQNARLDLDRAYSAELIADAGARQSQLAAGGSAGYMNSAFGFTDGSGDNSLFVGGSDQFRYKADFRKAGAASGVGTDNGFTHGFQNNDVRLRFYGTIACKDLAYKIQINGEDGVMRLEDAWGKYNFENGFSVMWGQFVHPLFRERNIDSEKQLAVDRSETEHFFDPDYTQGVEAIYAQDTWKLMFGFNDGMNTRNTPFNTGPGGIAGPPSTVSNEQDWALNARAEFIVAGPPGWARWDDFTSWKNQEFGALIGAGINWQQSGNTNPSTVPNPQSIAYTADASFEGAGWNAFAAFLGFHADPDTAGGKKEDDFGIVLQGGIFVADQWELFARWDFLHLDKDYITPGTKRNCHFITGGINYYLSPSSHAAKFTADVVVALSKTDGLASYGGFHAGNTGGIGNLDPSTGLLGQAKSGEVTFRAQGQVEF